jgi:hypothetical protein
MQSNEKSHLSDLYQGVDTYITLVAQLNTLTIAICSELRKTREKIGQLFPGSPKAASLQVEALASTTLFTEELERRYVELADLHQVLSQRLK